MAAATAGSAGPRMLSVTADYIVRMKDALFFDGEQSRRKLTKFWTSLPFAAVIATADQDEFDGHHRGHDVAPLMTPTSTPRWPSSLLIAVTRFDPCNLVLTAALLVRPVGSFPFNGFGLHDMAGNAWERTTDWQQLTPPWSPPPNRAVCRAILGSRNGRELRPGPTTAPNAPSSD